MNKATGNPDVLMRRMQSLSDESRLRLLHLLERQELGVAELCEILQLPQSTVSRHLKVLLDEGWTRSRRQGTTHLYRLVLDQLHPAARKLWLLTREQTHDWPTLAQDEMRLQRVLRQRESESQNFFAGAAVEWDRLRVEMYGRAFTTSALLALLDRTLVIADLGCGTGQLAEQLSPHVAQVIAVDNSQAMLKAARQRNAERANVDLRRGDLTAIPIDSCTCDAALLVLVLAYLPDPPAALKELHRVLKPSGKAVIVDLLPHNQEDFRQQLGQHWMGFAPDVLAQMLQSAGFASPTTVALLPEPGARGPAMFLATAATAPESSA
jgi:ArsR family transcriptional regulator